MHKKKTSPLEQKAIKSDFSKNVRKLYNNLGIHIHELRNVSEYPIPMKEMRIIVKHKIKDNNIKSSN